VPLGISQRGTKSKTIYSILVNWKARPSVERCPGTWDGLPRNTTCAVFSTPTAALDANRPTGLALIFVLFVATPLKSHSLQRPFCFVWREAPAST
jgi:hypothetical protein